MRTRTGTALVLAIGLVLTACGGDDGGDTGADGSASGGPTVAVASSDLGDILVDGDGMTLYAFLPDEGGTPTCTEDCLEVWPVFEGPATAGDGVDQSLLDTAEHPDGTTMATAGGWPLYYFASDAEPGDVNGQGIGENWYVVGPDGELIQEAASAEASSPSY